MSNIYYNPEDHGLEIIAELENSDGCYEFDTHLVFRHTKSGKLYYAHDSGCSCPTPFEDFHSIDDMEEVSDSFSMGSVKYCTIGEVKDFERKIREALPKKERAQVEPANA